MGTFNRMRLFAPPAVLISNPGYALQLWILRIMEIQLLLLQPAKALGISTFKLWEVLVSIGMFLKKYNTVTRCNLFLKMDTNYLIRLASPRKQAPGREWEPKSFLMLMGSRWGEKAGVTRKQDMDTPNWTKRIERQMKEKAAHQRQIFTMACTIPNNRS